MRWKIDWSQLGDLPYSQFACTSWGTRESKKEEGRREEEKERYFRAIAPIKTHYRFSLAEENKKQKVERKRKQEQQREHPLVAVDWDTFRQEELRRIIQANPER